MNITKAHSLLGRRNEEAMRQSARELGWVLTHGKMVMMTICMEFGPLKAHDIKSCYKSADFVTAHL